MYCLALQSTSQFDNREAIMEALEPYGGVFDCQRFRDLMMYTLSVFSYGLPRAMEILADCIWRPGLTEQEVSTAIVCGKQSKPPPCL